MPHFFTIALINTIIVLLNILILLDITMRTKKGLRKTYVYKIIGYPFLLLSLSHSFIYSGDGDVFSFLSDIGITFFLFFSFLSFYKNEKLFMKFKKSTKKIKK